jgi:flagellar biosynthesis/type III secretory pathway chaperone
MNAPAVPVDPSRLEAALRDVESTLADLLVATDEQYAAVAARDLQRLEAVTRQQERLSARLARAEAARQAALNGEALESAVAASVRAQHVYTSIAAAVTDLRARQARNASLLEQTAALADQTLNFLHRLVTTPSPSYGARGYTVQRRSMLVDGRA